ncbi:MAG: hypothetical protein ACOVO3_05455 [Fluviicola sp.]|jgi:hypothetical protein
MKANILTTMFVLLFLSVFGQEPATSQGKQAYTTLNASLEKLKTMDPTSYSFQSEIDKATKKIQTIKQYEPNFDLGAKEQLLQSFVKKQQEAQAAKEAKSAAANDAASSANDLYNEMEQLFRAPSISDFQEGVDSQLAPDAEYRLKDFQSKMEAFIANGAAEKIKQAKEYDRYIEPKDLSYERNGLEAILKELDEYVKNGSDFEGAMINYYVIKKYEIYWNTLEKVLPEDSQVASNAELARTYSAGLSSVSDIKANMEANKKASLAKVKVPAAVRIDAATETLFRNAFNATGWNEPIYKINLLDTDWHIERNNLTGAIIGRYQTAAITTKNANGDCVLYTFSIIQDYNGSAYQSKARRYGHNVSFISCENAQ